MQLKNINSLILLVFYLVLLSYCLPASAQNTFAIVSMVGDKLSLVRGGKQTGSNLNPNQSMTFDLPDGELDGQILLQVQANINKQCKACVTKLLKVKGPDTPDAQEKILPDLLGTAYRQNADWLIVLTKFRDEASLRLLEKSTGAGKLTGLGFYVDTQIWITDSETRQTARGLLAPYAYFKLFVIEVSTGNVKYSRGLTPTSTYSFATSPDLDIWNSIPDNRKIPTLLGLIRSELDRVLNLKNLGVVQ